MGKVKQQYLLQRSSSMTNLSAAISSKQEEKKNCLPVSESILDLSFAADDIKRKEFDDYKQKIINIDNSAKKNLKLVKENVSRSHFIGAYKECLEENFANLDVSYYEYNKDAKEFRKRDNYISFIMIFSLISLLVFPATLVGLYLFLGLPIFWAKLAVCSVFLPAIPLQYIFNKIKGAEVQIPQLKNQIDQSLENFAVAIIAYVENRHKILARKDNIIDTKVPLTDISNIIIILEKFKEKDGLYKLDEYKQYFKQQFNSGKITIEAVSKIKQELCIAIEEDLKIIAQDTASRQEIYKHYAHYFKEYSYKVKKLAEIDSETKPLSTLSCKLR